MSCPGVINEAPTIQGQASGDSLLRHEITTLRYAEGMKKIGAALTAIVLCVGVAGCGPAAMGEAEAVQRCEESISMQLKDPESSKFSSEIFGPKTRDTNAGETKEVPNKWTVVGLVNAKNSFGGYVGDKPFICELSTDESGVFSEMESATIISGD